MKHLYRGEVIEGILDRSYILQLEKQLQEDLILEPLSQKMVIKAVHQLIRDLDQDQLIREMVNGGISLWKAKMFVKTMLELFTGDALQKKIERELGRELYVIEEVQEGIEETYQPLGVLMHIGAGNVVALSVISIIEGLLTGNINILKLPSYEGGISIRLLKALVAIEPALKPYIYVFDIPSSDTDSLATLAHLVDALVVWGSDEAIGGIRQLAPAHLPLIEWGHRMSFAYFTDHDGIDGDIEALAKEICISDQQYCNSPQCVFYETEDREALHEFGRKLLDALIEANNQYPPRSLEPKEQAEITFTRELVKMEAVLEEKCLLVDSHQDVSVMIDYKPTLKPSPMNRNIWLMPIDRREVMSVIRKHHGHLQTVSLSCLEDEQEALSRLFYRLGVTRITRTGAMSRTYAGEPHDGISTLRRYVKCVSKRL